jgi:peptidoglycan hydrolase CwlO-like protein
MKKIIWFIVLGIVSYIVLIFFNPSIANKIATSLWIESFNEKVIEAKKTLDYISTKVPTKNELEKAYSWAKDTISNLKENIDDIRNTAKELEDKYTNAKKFIDETWKQIEQVKQTIGSIQEVIWTWATQ